MNKPIVPVFDFFFKVIAEDGSVAYTNCTEIVYQIKEKNLFPKIQVKIVSFGNKVYFLEDFIKVDYTRFNSFFIETQDKIYIETV